MQSVEDILKKSPLKSNNDYKTTFDPALLFAFPRSNQRALLNIHGAPPFSGIDVWNAYEISWLNSKGKPEIAIGQFYVPADSTYIFESKSLKLYLFSFYQTKFDSIKEVQTQIKKDLSELTKADIKVDLLTPAEFYKITPRQNEGICLNDLDIETSIYQVDPKLLKTSKQIVEEKLYTDLLRSNCLVTHQPDWASVHIHYIGPKIDQESFLKYIISYREHYEFGEHCAERIFMDLMSECKCENLCVQTNFTRRGGIDLNPNRSNFEKTTDFHRDFRQ